MPKIAEKLTPANVMHMPEMSIGLSVGGRLSMSGERCERGCSPFSVCAALKRETTGEYFYDLTTTLQVNGIIVKDTDAHYFKIDVTTIRGNVVLQGFVNSRDTKARLARRIGEIRGVKSVRTLLNVEERK